MLNRFPAVSCRAPDLSRARLTNPPFLFCVNAALKRKSGIYLIIRLIMPYSQLPELEGKEGRCMCTCVYMRM